MATTYSILYPLYFLEVNLLAIRKLQKDKKHNKGIAKISDVRIPMVRVSSNRGKREHCKNEIVCTEHLVISIHTP